MSDEHHNGQPVPIMEPSGTASPKPGGAQLTRLQRHRASATERVEREKEREVRKAALCEEARQKNKAKGHKDDCPCGLCKRMKDNAANAALKLAKGQKVRRKITVRQKRFAQEYANPNSPAFKNATRAAQLAGYSPDAAQSIGLNLLRSEQVQRRILTAYERHGITDDFLAAKMREGLEATVVEVAKHEGQITDQLVLADHHARHKYLETAHRLRGDFPREEPVQQAALILKLPDRMVTVEEWNQEQEEPAPTDVRKG